MTCETNTANTIQLKYGNKTKPLTKTNIKTRNYSDNDLIDGDHHSKKPKTKSGYRLQMSTGNYEECYQYGLLIPMMSNTGIIIDAKLIIRDLPLERQEISYDLILIGLKYFFIKLLKSNTAWKVKIFLCRSHDRNRTSIRIMQTIIRMYDRMFS
jgi:hypothetical protein